jgi:DNA recombination protein RmuC
LAEQQLGPTIQLETMPLGFQLFLAFLVGSGLGWLIGWLMARGKQQIAPADQRLESELRQQLNQREGELTQLRSEAVSIKTSLATAQANQTSTERLLAEQRALHERTLAEAKEAQAKALVELREAFKALSADALKQTAPEFLRLAEQSFGKFQETAKGDLSQRQEAIKGLVEPLKQQLDTYQRRLQQSETTQATTLGEVKKQLETLAQSSQSLAAETAQFRSVLKSNQARGRWGEETLRRVVEAAGMSAHCDFTEQKPGDEADKRPDMIVRLPGDRFIIVDAKVPELDFLSALEVADPTKRAESLAAHAGKLKATIKALADRDYPSQFPNALDYVVLFLPAESLFSAALEGDHDLIVWAAGKRIMLATPASLIALLRSVSVSWQQHSQTENAQKIAGAAQDFYARVVTFTEHFERIRDGLEKASDAYNKASASFQSRVRPAGERLAELGGGQEGKKLAELSPVESAVARLL